jgi:hypothetical protein
MSQPEEGISHVDIENEEKIIVRRLESSSNRHRYSLEPSPTLTDAELFREIAFNFDPVTDKVNGHFYADVYGEFLVPYLRRKHHVEKKPVVFFEIGLGCDICMHSQINKRNLLLI